MKMADCGPSAFGLQTVKADVGTDHHYGQQPPTKRSLHWGTRRSESRRSFTWPGSRTKVRYQATYATTGMSEKSWEVVVMAAHYLRLDTTRSG